MAAWGIDPLFTLAIAWSLAVLFGASTAHKAASLQEWLAIVRNYRLLPERLVATVAALVLVAGGLTAVALVLPATRRLAGCGAAVQLLVFAAALAVNVRRGRTSIDCGCLGSALRGREGGISGWMAARNVLLAVLAACLLLPVAPRELTALDLATCAGCVATVCFLYPVIAVVLQRSAAP